MHRILPSLATHAHPHKSMNSLENSIRSDRNGGNVAGYVQKGNHLIAGSRQEDGRKRTWLEKGDKKLGKNKIWGKKAFNNIKRQNLAYFSSLPGACIFYC